MIRLTPKEVEVLQLSALGLMDKQIAKRLGVRPATVNSRAQRGQLRLGCVGRAHAVALLVAAGVIEGPQPPVPLVVAENGHGDRSLVEFAEDYKILRARGMTHREIAAKLDLRFKTVGRYASRARKAGLLPPYSGRAS